MNIRIELRFAVLNSLLMLLWFSVEYLIGLQDKFIAIYPYVTIFAILIPVFCTRMALLEKTEMLFQKINFRQAFICGLIITALASIFIVPVQYAFLKLINPDFLDNMILYAVSHHQSKEAAQVYFDPGFYIAQSAVLTFITGTIVSLVLARLMRTQ